MRTLLRFLAFLVVGLLLAQAFAWIIGRFAAVTWDRETYEYVASDSVLTFLVLSLGMAALPVALLAALTGTALFSRIRTHVPAAVLLVSLPWAITLFTPPGDMTNLGEWLAYFFTDPHSLAVLLALPVGMLFAVVPRILRMQPSAA